MIQPPGILRAKLVAQDHVAEFYGMRQQSFFLKFLKSLGWIVVIHGILPRAAGRQRTRDSLIPLYAKESRHTPAFLKAEEGKSGSGSADGHELVTFDFRGNAGLAIVGRFHANHFAVTAYVHVPGRDHLLREGKNKIDVGAVF